MKIVEPETEKKVDSRFTLLDKSEFPSRGSFYDTDIYIRKMSIQHITDLSVMTKDTETNVINHILNECVHGIDYPKICLGDRIWLLYKLRFNTFKSQFKMKFDCDVCTMTTWSGVKLSDLVVYYYNPNFEKSVKLPNNDVITIKYPTIGTDLQIKKKMNDPNVIGGIHYVLMSIASHIDTINSKKIGLFESYEYVNNLDPDTYEAFVNFLLTVKFGCTGKVKHTCQCGNTGFYDLDLSSDFFIPKEN